MSTTFCPQCEKRFEIYKKEVLLVERKNLPSGPAIPIVVWRANILLCPQCGFKIAKIKDQRPLAICIDPDFAERLERIKENHTEEEIVYFSQ